MKDEDDVESGPGVDSADPPVEGARVSHRDRRSESVERQLQAVQRDMEAKLKMHVEAAVYYAKLYNRYTFSAAVLSLIGAVGTIAASSSALTWWREPLTVVFGVLTLVSTVIQAIVRVSEPEAKFKAQLRAAEEVQIFIREAQAVDMPRLVQLQKSWFDVMRECRGEVPYTLITAPYEHMLV